MEQIFYSKTHEWLKVDGDKAYVGISDFAQSEIGDITYIDLPYAGDHFSINGCFGSIESVKSSSDLYIPVGGTILNTNTSLEDDPAQINNDAMSAWIIQISIDNLSELDNLMTEEEYKKYIER